MQFWLLLEAVLFVELIEAQECKLEEMKSIKTVRRMGGGPMETPNPFLFCVYHKDEYPAGNEKMEVPDGRGNGMDFDNRKPYRFYHGSKVPGFPQHPHRGFETITATIEGVIDHGDSMGNGGRYGQGDLQWMTAGKGIVHSEMFPLIHKDKKNTNRFFQIWLNLEKKNKMVDPYFVMHWAHDIKHWTSDDKKVETTIWAGTFKGENASGSPPPDSYASNLTGGVGVFFIQMEHGGKITLDPCEKKNDANRFIYFVEGDVAKVGGQMVQKGDTVSLIETFGAAEIPIEAISGKCEFLVLQGNPIDEPVVQHGPFVMNTREEIMKAFSDYQQTQFGGWPWPRDDHVFPRTKGRFASQNGKETAPPNAKLLSD